MSPFDYLNSINTGKGNLDTSDYVPFMVNRGLSYHQDTTLLANEMNRYPDIDHKLQYDFFKNSVRPRKRYAKWQKAEKLHKDIDIIKTAYNYSREKAEAAYNILTKEQLKELRKIWSIKSS
jgi:hypothetical protein|tara:strand:- start:537 stop:899 length:363 start_codon:yes stop_codon:yes gene_type:complete